MFIYTKHLNKQLNAEIAALDAETSSFSTANMQKVLEFEKRLQQASGRLNNGVSIVSIFKALEAATIDTVMLNSLSMHRELDDKYILTASINTDSFDSTIFQRGEFQQSQVISDVVISGVSTGGEEGEVSEGESSDDSTAAESESSVTLTAVLDIPVSAILYEPSDESDTPITIINSSSVDFSTPGTPADEVTTDSPNAGTVSNENSI
jgi:hypothetical protein